MKKILFLLVCVLSIVLLTNFVTAQNYCCESPSQDACASPVEFGSCPDNWNYFGDDRVCQFGACVVGGAEGPCGPTGQTGPCAIPEFSSPLAVIGLFVIGGAVWLIRKKKK